MFVKVENRKIHFKKLGKGKPILFVHGWGGTLYSLHALALLASKKYSAILLDLPGFGKSSNPPPHWGVEGYAEIIYKFSQELKLIKPHYVGHSFGGELGIYLAAHYPSLIDKLIISNSSFRREQKVSKFARLFKTFPKNKFSVLKTLEPFIKKTYYNLFHKESDLFKYPHLEANFRKIIAQDLTPETKRIAVNTLLLWGEDDTITPVIWGYELKKSIPESFLKVFPKVKHNLPLLYPQEVWTEIETFLNN